MLAHDQKFGFSISGIVLSWLIIQTVCPLDRTRAINITVDYRYDTNNFFNTQQKRDALQAAAARYSAVITTSLSAASLADSSTDPRIGFTHPGTGANFEVSAASGSGSDALLGIGAPVANEYRGPWSIAANEWILYAGGRPLSVGGFGGTGTGWNVTSVYTSGSSHLNRGFRTSGGFSNLPLWGGAVTFDNDGSTVWHFDLNTPSPGSSSDFYSIALHEIGHALGLSGNFLEWTNHVSGTQFVGPNARSAYNADNGTAVSGLTEVNAAGNNHHWQDGTYDSRIFAAGSPRYVGTVGPGALQDLLMEPTANYTASIRRFELTNVDVGAMRDVGWTVTSQAPGDFNNDGAVDARDYVIWRKTDGSSQGYTAWRSNFGSPAGNGSASFTNRSVPEPASVLLLILAPAAISSEILRISSRVPVTRCR